MEEPIYEKLQPNECFIISRSEEGLLVVENHKDGEVVIRRVPIPEEQGMSNHGIDDLDDYGCDGDCDVCEHTDGCYEEDDYEDEMQEQDSGFFGSFLEAQLVRDGQKICLICGKKVSSILEYKNGEPCKAECHGDFKLLFEVRCKIGLHDLKTRGYD